MWRSEVVSRRARVSAPCCFCCCCCLWPSPGIVGHHARASRLVALCDAQRSALMRVRSSRALRAGPLFIVVYGVAAGAGLSFAPDPRDSAGMRGGAGSGAGWRSKDVAKRRTGPAGPRSRGAGRRARHDATERQRRSGNRLKRSAPGDEAARDGAGRAPHDTGQHAPPSRAIDFYLDGLYLWWSVPGRRRSSPGSVADGFGL